MKRSKMVNNESPYCAIDVLHSLFIKRLVTHDFFLCAFARLLGGYDSEVCQLCGGETG